MRFEIIHGSVKTFAALKMPKIKKKQTVLFVMQLLKWEEQATSVTEN